MRFGVWKNIVSRELLVALLVLMLPFLPLLHMLWSKDSHVIFGVLINSQYQDSQTFMWYILSQVSLFGIYSLFYIFSTTKLRYIFFVMSYYHYMAFFCEILDFGLSHKIIFTSEGIILSVSFLELIVIRKSKHIKRAFQFDDYTSRFELIIEALGGRGQRINRKIQEVKQHLTDSSNIRDVYQLYHLKILVKKEIEKCHRKNSSEVSKDFLKVWLIPIILILTIGLKILVYNYDENEPGFNFLGVQSSNSFGFVNAKSFAWYFSGKLEILVYSIAWIIYSESWWKYVILPGICLFSLQFWEMFQSKISLETDITIQALPLTIAVIVLSSVITKIVLAKAKLLDNLDYLEAEVEKRLEKVV